MKKIYLIISCLFLASFSAYAEEDIDKGGFYIEPGITYGRSEADMVYPNTLASSEVELEGPGAFVRLGGHVWESIFLGFDGHYTRASYDDALNNIDVKVNEWNAGPLLGNTNAFAGLRVWANYVMLGALDPEEENGFDSKFTDPSGWRFGAGIKIHSVSLNLEYQDIEYEDAELENPGRFSIGTTFNNISLREKGWLASISVPLSL